MERNNQSGATSSSGRLPGRIWRRTKEGRDALKAFPGRKVAELAAIVEAGPGFRNTEARAEFRYHVREWAWRWMQRKHHYEAASTPKKIRRDLERVAEAADALEALLGELPDAALDLLGRFMSGPLADPSVAKLRIAVSRFGIVAWKAARAAPVRRGPPEKFYRGPLQQLGWIWSQATGKRPTMTYDLESEERQGPFRDFACAACEVLWPEMGSVDELLREVGRGRRRFRGPRG